MRFKRIILPLCLTLMYATVGLAQVGDQKSKPSSTPGTTAPEITLQARSGRAAVVRLKSGESIISNFLGADEDTIEIQVADKRQKIKLDEVASITFSAQEGAQGNESSAASQQAKTPLLLLSRRCGRDERFVFVRGEVKNTSSKPLKNVNAVGTFLTKSGAVAKVEWDLIGDMSPGQTASFDVVWYNNPQIESCEISFRFFRGAVIPHTELIQR